MFTNNTTTNSKTNSNSKTKSYQQNRRNKFQLSFLIPFILFSLISCESEDFKEDSLKDKIAATFTSTIDNTSKESVSTRAAGITWHKNDYIGIFAVEAQQDLSDETIYNGYSNLKYVTQAAGEVAKLKAVEDEILFPRTDQIFDFIAYYPYSDLVNDFTLPIDISQQDPQSDIDILYATAKDHDAENPNVEFKFKHILSQLQLELTSEEEINLQDVVITIKNASTNAHMNLSNGVVAVDSNKETITPIINYDAANNKLLAKAILLPGQELESIIVQIQLLNDESYIWSPASYTLEPNVARVYKLNIAYNDIELIDDGSTIEDWEYSIDDAVHIIKPVTEDYPDDPANPDDPLKGTVSNPYTVSEAIINQLEDAAWVEGYIIGFAVKEGTTSRVLVKDLEALGVQENIVLADTIFESDVNSMIPVKLTTTGDENLIPYQSLNLKDNSYLMNRKVKIYCQLARYQNGPGGRKIIDYKILPKETEE